MEWKSDNYGIKKLESLVEPYEQTDVGHVPCPTVKVGWEGEHHVFWLYLLARSFSAENSPSMKRNFIC